MEFSADSTAVTLLYILAVIFLSSCSAYPTEVSGADYESHQFVNVTPTILVKTVSSKDFVLCARAPISGLSRLELGSYSSAHRITLVPSEDIQRKLHAKIQICLHKNFSLGLCQCENDNWEGVENGIWSSIISPYEDKFIDVKFSNNLSGSVSISIKVEFHRWRLMCLAIGFVLLLLAPIISSWVPFYYSSSMAIGICLVIIILLFQGMKLFPTGRKNALYSTICGLALGVGSFLLNRFSMYVKTILINFGLSEEMHNPVLVFLIVGIILAGAGFGYWLVRKFVVTEDGSVDVGIARFVKWALYLIAAIFIFQSTFDTPLAIAVLVSFLVMYFSLISMKWLGLRDFTHPRYEKKKGRSSERVNKKHKRAEFRSQSGTMILGGTSRKSPTNAASQLNSPQKGTSSRSGASRRGTGSRKKTFKEELNDFSEESTRDAVAKWTSSPEFTDWIIKNADKIRIRQNRPTNSSESSDDSDESTGSD